MKLCFSLLFLTACGGAQTNSPLQMRSPLTSIVVPVPTKHLYQGVACDLDLTSDGENVWKTESRVLLTPGTYQTGGPIFVRGVQVSFSPYCQYSISKGTFCTVGVNCNPFRF